MILSVIPDRGRYFREMASSGLLEQAKERRYRLDMRLGESSEMEFTIVDDGAGKSQLDEDPEVLSEIESLISGRQLPRDAMVVRRGEGSLGIGLPIVVNLLLAALVGISLYAVTTIFNTREEALALDTAEVFSTESRIIEEIRRSSEEQLSEKEAEIDAIESQLSSLAESKRELEENLDAEVAGREAELRAQLNAELEAERQRLQALGTSEADIAERIEELEAEREAEVESQVQAYRDEVEAEFNARIDELESDTAALEEQLAQERADLEAQLSEAQEAAGAAQQRLQTLESEQATTQLFQDQLAGTYEQVFSALRNDNYGAAREALEGLSALFDTPTFLGVSQIQARRETQLRVADSILSLINQEERLAEQRSALEDQLASVEGDRAGASAELLEEQQQTITTLEQTNESVRESLQQSQTEVERLSGLVSNLEQQSAALNEREAELEARISELEADRTSLQQSLAAQEDELGQEITQLESDLAKVRSERDQLQAALETERAESVALEEQLEDELEDQESALSSSAAEQESRIAELRAELARLEEQRESQAQRVAELEAEVDRVVQEAERRVAEAQAEERRATLNRVIAVVESSDADSGSASEPEDQASAAEASTDDAEIEEAAETVRRIVVEQSRTTGLNKELLGLVTASGDPERIAVRTLTASSAEIGDRVEIRRGTRTGDGILVAVGEVTRASAGVVDLRVSATERGLSVQASDAVFVLDQGP